MAKTRTKTRNKRYRKNEEAILDALTKTKGLPTAGGLARKARISKSTLYRHHRTVPGIIPDYKKKILIKYDNMVRQLNRRKNTQVRTICLRTLIFIVANRRVFKILLKYDGSVIIEGMILKLKNKLKNACRLPKNSDKMLRVYAKEVAGVIEEWSEHGFREDEIELTLNKILYLTETMRQRLGPLNY